MTPDEVLEAAFPLTEEDECFGEVWFDEYPKAREQLQKAHGVDSQQAPLISWVAVKRTEWRLGLQPAQPTTMPFVSPWMVHVLEPTSDQSLDSV